MKRTELQQAIEEIITEILSENTLKTQSSQEIDQKIQDDPEFLKKIRNAMAKAEKGDTTDLTMAIAGLKEVEDDDDALDDTTLDKDFNKKAKEEEKKNKKTDKKKDEIISAYKKIAGDIKEKAKAANSGNKEAKAWIDKHQDIIKAYRKLQKAS